MSVDHRPARWFELGLLLSLGFIWGTPYALTKLALATIPPITMVAARVVLAAAVLWAIIFFRRSTLPNLRQFAAPIFFQGLICCVFPYTLIAFGQQSVDSALTAILNSTTPLFVCLIGVTCLRQQPQPPERWLGVAVGLSGVVLIAGASALLGLGQMIAGQLAIIIGTFSSAISVIFGRKFSTIAPEVTAAGALTSAAVVLVPLCFLKESPLSVTPSAVSLAAMMVNGIFATAAGFVLYFRLIARIGSVGVASVGYLKPCFGVLIGWVLMAEPMTWTVAIGLAAILAGVAAMNRRTEPNFANTVDKSLARAR
jgi:drug/metabolite transporter (DMT)-like permease